MQYQERCALESVESSGHQVHILLTPISQCYFNGSQLWFISARVQGYKGLQLLLQVDTFVLFSLGLVPRSYNTMPKLGLCAFHRGFMWLELWSCISFACVRVCRCVSFRINYEQFNKRWIIPREYIFNLLM